LVAIKRIPSQKRSSIVNTPREPYDSKNPPNSLSPNIPSNQNSTPHFHPNLLLFRPTFTPVLSTLPYFAATPTPPSLNAFLSLLFFKMKNTATPIITKTTTTTTIAIIAFRLNPFPTFAAFFAPFATAEAVFTPVDFAVLETPFANVLVAEDVAFEVPVRVVFAEVASVVFERAVVALTTWAVVVVVRDQVVGRRVRRERMEMRNENEERVVIFVVTGGE
jgi:hypothetical protein